MHETGPDIKAATSEGSVAQIEERGETIGLMASAGFRRSLPDGVVSQSARGAGAGDELLLQQPD